jgi:excinuclease ABC subunit B
VPLDPRAHREEIGERCLAEPRIDYAALDPETLAAKIKKLEAQMYKHAQDLDFEAAAKVRDELKRVKAQGLVS